MKVPTKKSECIKSGSRLLVISKKGVVKKYIKNTEITYLVSVEAFPMSYAYSDQLMEGVKFIGDSFSVN